MLSAAIDCLSTPGLAVSRQLKAPPGRGARLRALLPTALARRTQTGALAHSSVAEPSAPQRPQARSARACVRACVRACLRACKTCRDIVWGGCVVPYVRCAPRVQLESGSGAGAGAGAGNRWRASWSAWPRAGSGPSVGGVEKVGIPASG